MKPIEHAAGRRDPRPRRLHGLEPRERGFSLFIVVIMLLLSALLAVGGARVAALLESMAGNQREYQRAFEAAEAALVDAERDIRQLAYDSATQTYVHCSALAASPCRKPGIDRGFPEADAGGVTVYAASGDNSCAQGICFFAGAASVSAASGSEAYAFWTRDAYAKAHAAYGRYTGAPKAGSLALENTRYWIEVIDRPNSRPLYRITALSTGARSAGTTGGTRVVLQMAFDPDPVRALQ